MSAIRLAKLETLQRSIDSIEISLRSRKESCQDKRYIDRIERSRSWLARSYQALAGNELELGFICLWIAFNALYGVADEEEFSKSMQRFLPKILEPHSVFKEQLVEELQPKNLRTLLNNPFLVKRNWSSGVYRSLPQKFSEWERYNEYFQHANYRVALDMIISRICVLRNQLFHGCSTHSRGTNKGSLVPAIETLIGIVPCFWNIVASSSDVHGWGKLPYTRAER